MRLLSRSRYSGSPRVSWTKVLAVVCYHLLVLFFLHSVSSYFRLLKAEKRAQRRAASLDLASECLVTGDLLVVAAVVVVAAAAAVVI